MKFKKWLSSGDPWVWINAGAVSISLLIVAGLLVLIAARGLGHFWPKDIYQIEYQIGSSTENIIGEIVSKNKISTEQFEESGLGIAPEGEEEVERWLIKTGNREMLSFDFRWINAHDVKSISTPDDLVVIERVEWGNFYGYIKSIATRDGRSFTDNPWDILIQHLDSLEDIKAEIHIIEKSEIGRINYQLESLRLKRKGLALDNLDTPESLAEITQKENALQEEFEVLQAKLFELYDEVAQDKVTMTIMDGREKTMTMDKIVSVLKPNEKTVFSKLILYFVNFYRFIVEEPREANTEGGVFPAIIGTVMMVMVMSIIVTPLGVIAAVYLREYAKQGAIIRLIRIAVNNLAGVPSIVYGVFGLGFFVYFLGGNIDKLFYQEALPAPTFGTPGLIWASLTLALLTLPVVIVSTEEGLARIPKSMREGSLALGATKAETIWRVVLPMSSPAIMTGLILAVARAAGEVAPLMLVGVVKLAPELPFDLNFPFMHLDRKFMHLGFHIYDVGFQSPNVEAARPLVYATAFLLVLVIVILNLTAIMLRNRLRERYRSLV